MRVLTGHEIGPENLQETLTGPRVRGESTDKQECIYKYEPRDVENHSVTLILSPLSSLVCPESLLSYCLPVSTSRAVPGRGESIAVFSLVTKRAGRDDLLRQDPIARRRRPTALNSGLNPERGVSRAREAKPRAKGSLSLSLH